MVPSISSTRGVSELGEDRYFDLPTPLFARILALLPSKVFL